MSVTVESFKAWATLSLVAAGLLLQPGCVGTEGGSGAAGSGGDAGATAGSSASGGNASGGAAGDGPCRAGVPTVAAPLFQKLAGTYPFPARDKACDFQGHSYAAPESYTVTLGANPQTVKVATSEGSELFEATWSDAADVACQDELNESFVLQRGADTVRVAFLNGEFSSISFGQCWFVAN